MKLFTAMFLSAFLGFTATSFAGGKKHKSAKAACHKEFKAQHKKASKVEMKACIAEKEAAM